MNEYYEGIQELLDLDDIEECEKSFVKVNKYYPFNISTWDPSEYFLNHYILNQVILSTSDYIHYLYSYELPPQKINSVLEKLGAGPERGNIITNNGTSSISLVTAILKEIGINRILIISPAYYAVFYNCIQRGIEIKELSMLHNNYGYQLPVKQIDALLDTIDAIWITNPIYNTGVYYTYKDIAYLKNKILPHKLLICDECFALHNNELIRSFCNENNFIGIYDPMKQVMINGLKFSMIIFSNEFQDIMNQWSDIVCGSLSYSTVQGIDFFISNRFDMLSKKININNTFEYENVTKIIKDFPAIYIDKPIAGHMMMCYVKNLNSEYFQKKENLYNTIWKTSVSLIPGNRFHFNADDDFCFRINLARIGPGFHEALEQLFEYFNLITV